MDIIETLQAVSQNLRALFEDKGELRGFHDWDVLIGCVVALDRAAESLQTVDNMFGADETAEETEGDEDVTDG